MNKDPVKFVQLSDSHLFAADNGELLGVNTLQSFQAALDLLRHEKEAFDFIIHSGDISQDYSEASYVKLAEILKPFNVPVYCVPGNHDDPKVIDRVYPLESISHLKHVLLKNWQIILLDSHKPDAVEGFLDQTQLNHLTHCLQSYPNHRAIVLFHHHPFPVGCRWLDNLGLKNADEFWQLVSQYPNMHTVLFGHVHQQVEKKFQGIPCYSTPSTCIQFKRQQDEFGLEKLPPAYRWLHLYDDGRLETGVKRVEEYVGTFDVNAKGY